MGIKVSTEAVYFGVKTGLKKTGEQTGEQWVALQFKAVESYKGTTIEAGSMANPNMTIFPPDNLDRSSLVVGNKYLLSLAVSGSKNSSYPQFELLAFKNLN